MKREDLFTLLMCSFLGMLGGLGRILSTKSRKPLKVQEIAKGTAVSLIIGVGAFVIVYGFFPQLKENVWAVYAIGWGTGWGGPLVVGMAMEKWLKDKGIDITKGDGKK